MANLYFADDLDPGLWRPGAVVTVTGDEARHAVRVSRLRVDEQILLGDGRGVRAQGVVEMVAKDRFSVRLETVERSAAVAHRIVLVQALAKGDRDERAVEQATEFGVDAVVPWQAERSVSRWDGAGGADKAAKGVAKWERIAKEASKQSLRSRVPEVRAPLALAGLCALASSAGIDVVALHPRGDRTLAEWAGERAGLGAWAEETLVVIGPEGGFSDQELTALETAGADVLRLGSTVLRTSSAGPAGIAVLNVALGRW